MAIAVDSTSNTPTYGSRTNSTITAPASIADGNVLVAILHVGHASALPALSVTPPTGFTEVTNSPSSSDDPAPYEISIRVFSKVSSGESGNYTFTHAAAETEGYMFRLAGADTSTPIDVTPAAQQYALNQGLTTQYASLTTVTDGAFLIYAESCWDAPGAGAVSGSTPSISVRRSGTISWIGDGTQATAGATGARTRTNGNSGNSSPWASIVVAIRPATSTQALSGRAAASIAAGASANARTAISGRATSAAKAALGVTLQLFGSSLLRAGAAANLTQQSTTTSEPILVSATSSAFNTATTPKTVSGVSVQNGDVILVHGMMEHGGDSGILGVSTTSGSTTSWTLLADVPGTGSANQSYLRTWSATATATGTISVAVARSGGAGLVFGATVKVYRNSGGVGAVQAANNGTGSGTPSITLTTTRDRSVLDFANADWNAVSGTVTFTSSAGTPVEDLNVLPTGLYRVTSSHVNAGNAGSKTIGMSGPSAQRYVAVAIEIFGLGQVGSLVARVSVGARASGVPAGSAGLGGGVLSLTRGAAAFSGRAPLAGGTKIATRAGLFSQVVILAMQTRFMPAMRGTLTLITALGSSAGTGAMFRMRGDSTARTALSGKSASASRSTAGVGAGTLLSGAAKVSSGARSTFSGRVILAMQTRIFPAMRGALNAAAVPTALALSAAAAVVSRARAAAAGRTSLEGGASVSGRATGGLSAIAAMTARTATKAMGAATTAVRAALAATSSVRTASRGAMAGVVALFGRAASTVAARFSAPGTVVLLIARTTAALQTAAGMVSRTALTAATATATKASAAAPLFTTALRAAAGIAVAVRTGATAVTDIAVTARAVGHISAKAAASGVTSLAGRTSAMVRAGFGGGAAAVVARAAVRVAARALLFVLAPVIPTPVTTRLGRLSRLNASLLKAFGEAFDITPMTQGVDVNSRSVRDISRPPLLNIQGIWDGPTTSRTPHARGALQDDNAHNWNASYPSANFDDTLVAGVRKGDVLTRKLDGAVYEIVRVVPNGFGRTTLQLSKRKRTN